MTNNTAQNAAADEMLSSDLPKDPLVDRTKLSKPTQSEGGGEGQQELRQYYNSVETDLAAAYQWLCKSADSGNSEARNELGRLYERGLKGLPEDRAISLFWYRMSGYLSESEVKYSDEKFSTPEIAAVDRLMNDWQPGDCEEMIKAKLETGKN